MIQIEIIENEMNIKIWISLDHVVALRRKDKQHYVIMTCCTYFIKERSYHKILNNLRESDED